MVEWSVCWTCNPAVPGQVLLWPLAGFVLCGPEFKSSAMLVNSQLVCLWAVEILNMMILHDV